MSSVPSTSIPDGFARTILELHGADGATWLAGLPDLVADCEREWSLTASPPFEPLSYNYVAPATLADGTPAVLKVGFPSAELRTEMDALRVYDGRGSVLLLAADPDKGALLLERLLPGTTLLDLADDSEATRVAAEVMRRLWRPVPAEHRFPSVADWAKGFGWLRGEYGGSTGPLPERRVAQAEVLFGELMGSMAAPVVLHGDLHHANILAAGPGQWRAIDPKGVVGEPAYEVGALLRNVAPQFLTRAPLGRILFRRVDQLADVMGFDGWRLRGWGMAQAVLSAIWSLEDHGHGWEWAMACAEALAGG